MQLAPKGEDCTFHHFKCKLWHNGYAKSYKIIAFRLNRTLASDFLFITKVLSHTRFTARRWYAERGYATVSRASARLSVRLWRLCVFFSHKLEYFENNFKTDWLKVPGQIDPNMSDLFQREHPQNRVEQGWGHKHKNL